MIDPVDGHWCPESGDYKRAARKHVNLDELALLQQSPAVGTSKMGNSFCSACDLSSTCKVLMSYK